MSKAETGVSPLHQGSDSDASPTRDTEKATNMTHGPIDTSFEDKREVDFMTRNGLNFKSFQRRKLPSTHVLGQVLMDIVQAPKSTVLLISTAP